MSEEKEKERERRAKEVARAVYDSKKIRGYVKIWFHDKSKEYIVVYLIHAIQSLKEIHDQYNPLGKENKKDE